MPVPQVERHAADQVAVPVDVDGTSTFERDDAGVESHLPDTSVELGTRHGAAVVGKRTTRPGQQQLLTEPGRAQAPVAAARAHPVAEAELIELGDRPGGQA